MMIIDTHQHAFYHQRDDTGLIADMDEQGIDVAWLLSWEMNLDHDHERWLSQLNPLNLRQDGTHAGVPLRDLLLAQKHYPNRFIVGYCPHPAVGNAAELFEAAYNMHGVRVCGEWKFRMLFDDPRCLELFNIAGRLGAPVVLHLDVPYLLGDDNKQHYQPRWYGGTVANLERALQACPQTNFIGHAPGFWREIGGDADLAPLNRPIGPVKPGGRLSHLFDSYTNLYADLSASSALRALSRDSEHARKFMNQFADRILFGRDYYGGELHQFLKTLELPDHVIRQIYSENAQRLVPKQANNVA